MLYSAKKLVRAVVSSNIEFRVKRGLIGHPTATDCFVSIHASMWKAGSQFLKLLLSDIRICREGGVRPYNFESQTATSWGDIEGEDRPLICAYFGDPDEIPEGLSYRSVFVAREPTACFRSWLRSTLYTHPPNPGINRIRANLAPLSIEAKADYLLNEYITTTQKKHSGWLRKCLDGETTFVEFRNAIGSAEKIQTEILGPLGLTVSPRTVDRAFARYSRLIKVAGGKYAGPANDAGYGDFEELLSWAEPLYLTSDEPVISLYRSNTSSEGLVDGRDG